MKVLVNWRDSICATCGKPKTAIMAPEGNVECSFCGSFDLVDHSWQCFVPKFKLDARNSGRKGWLPNHRRFDDARNFQRNP